MKIPTLYYSGYIRNVCSNIYSNNGMPFLNVILPSFKDNLVCSTKNSADKKLKYCISVAGNVSLLKNTTFFMEQSYDRWKMEMQSCLTTAASTYLEDILNGKEQKNNMEELKSIMQNPLKVDQFSTKPLITIDVHQETISNLYAKNYIDYIQIRDYGLYHTGRNIANFDVPLFQCEQEIRFIPYFANKNIHLLMSLKPKNINQIKKSQYSLDISDTLTLPPYLYLGLK
jgi:hypothetical protein